MLRCALHDGLSKHDVLVFSPTYPPTSHTFPQILLFWRRYSGLDFNLVPFTLENGSGFHFIHIGVSGTEPLGASVGIALAFFIGGHRAIVLFATTVIGIEPRPGEAHLDEFSSHVDSHKVVGLQIRLKQAVNRGR